MVTIRTILCPIDFSSFSRDALMCAVGIAKRRGASITAVHMVSSPSTSLLAEPEAHAPAASRLGQAEKERLLSKLDAFTREVAGGVATTVGVVETTAIAAEIAAQAERLRVDLVVIGTHGRTGFQRLLLGSTTEKVVRICRQPVLTVGAPSKVLDGRPTEFNRILCAIDFSAYSMTALKYALSLAEGSAARVTALNVIEFMPVGHHPFVGSSFDPHAYRVAVEGINRERLQMLLTDAAPANQNLRGVVTAGKPHHEILRVADEMKADLIVLGVHGRYPIDRVLLGATAEPVLRRAGCAVLTVRADDPVSAVA